MPACVCATVVNRAPPEAGSEGDHSQIFAITHLYQAVALCGDAAIVGSHDKSDAFGAGEFEQQVKDLAAGALVERAGGLVGQQNSRLVHQGAAKGGALAFPSGQLLDALVEAMRQSGALGEFVQARESFFAGSAGGDGGNQAVLFKSQVGDQVVELEDETDLMTKTYCERRRLVRSAPLTNTRPRVGSSRPPRRWSKVLLPHPEGRRAPPPAPGNASKSTPLRTWMEPSS